MFRWNDLTQAQQHQGLMKVTLQVVEAVIDENIVPENPELKLKLQNVISEYNENEKAWFHEELLFHHLSPELQEYVVERAQSAFYLEPTETVVHLWT